MHKLGSLENLSHGDDSGAKVIDTLSIKGSQAMKPLHIKHRRWGEPIPNSLKVNLIHLDTFG